MFCPFGLGPFGCPPGYYSNGSSTSCHVCPRGTFCEAGSDLPKLCPAGEFCDNIPQSCPQGFYSSAGSVDCTPCPAGYYCHFCVAGSGSAAPCPLGTFSPAAGNSQQGQCTLCTAGMACPRGALTAPLENCELGHYCPSGTIYPTHAPIQKCSRGHFCPAGTSFPTQYPCPPGTFTESNELASAAECTACPPGFYCLGGEAKVSGQCPTGYYCPTNTESSFQFPCPAGTYNSQVGITSVEGCLECPPGNFCLQGSSFAIPCFAGTYS
ncbi:hypothetical protein GUITHDRAFT_72301, partial [Guillardia theta CCMP2712]